VSLCLIWILAGFRIFSIGRKPLCVPPYAPIPLLRGNLVVSGRSIKIGLCKLQRKLICCGGLVCRL
jgi:hypothetical protein